MSGTAHIYDADINPTKQEIVARYGAITDYEGSYRLVDFDGDEVGIEVHVGRDVEGRLSQMPVTYRSGEIDPLATLTTMEHSVLGTRWVSNALGDPIAVREFIRTIVTGDDGAEYSNGDTPVLDVRGSGEDKDVEVGEVKLTEFTRQRAVGTVVINGSRRSFKLRMSNLLSPARVNATGYTTPKLRLTGTTPAGGEVIAAEFSWGDQVTK